jgi:hypothetical protein
LSSRRCRAKKNLDKNMSKWMLLASVYVGQFIAGRRHGKGTLTHAGGQRSSGEWIDGELSGACRIEYPEQKLYEGQCSAGKPSGRGRYDNPVDKSHYEGEFRDGRYHGEGKLVEKEMTYTGQFMNGLKEGTGKETSVEGVDYEGMFARGVPHGRGVLRINPTATYEGEFSNGLMDGAGLLKAEKLVMDGRFKRNHFVSGKLTTADGRMFELDTEKGSIEEVMKDGTRRVLNELPSNIEI